MAASLRLPGVHRHHRLAAIQRLNLRLFIDAQHRGMFWRRDIQSDHIAHLGNEVRIGGQFERLVAVWLQAKSPPDALHAAHRNPAGLRHAAGTPVRGAVRLALQRGHHHGFDPGIVDFAGCAGARLIVQPSRRCDRKRRRHLPTVMGCRPRLLATSLFCVPSAQARMIRARIASACAVLRRPANPFSSARSASLRVSSTSRRPATTASHATGRSLDKGGDSLVTTNSNRRYDELPTRDTSASCH